MASGWRPAWLERGGQSYPPLDTLADISVPEADNRGNEWFTPASDIDARPNLLPPEDICNWDRCDCAAVAEWRGARD